MIEAATTPNRPFESQQDRLVSGLVYLAGLLFVSGQIHGQLIPPFSEEGLWFYGGFVPLLLARILEPWFPRPADAIANGIALVIATAALSIPDEAEARQLLEAARIALAAYGGLLILLSAIAMLWRSSPGVGGAAAGASTSLVRTLGQARLVYSLFLAFVVGVTQGDTPTAIGLVVAAWVVIVLLRPAEAAIGLFRRWRPSLVADTGIAFEHAIDPRIVVARAESGEQIPLGTTTTWANGGRGVVVDRTELLDGPRLLISATGGSGAPRGLISVSNAEPEAIVGYVADKSSINELVLAATADVVGGSEVTEGRLVAADIRGAEVLFQVTSAIVVESPEWGLRRQSLEIRARKLGTWNDTEQGFVLKPWVADAGGPVRLVATVDEQTSGTIGGVGHIPGTGYGIGIRTDSAVLFNTAILGILGVGKTSLAWELIQRMLCEGLRVVVLDITGEYGLRFRDLISPSAERLVYDVLEGFLAPRRGNQGTPRETAGNWGELRPGIREVQDQMEQSDSRLLILNPSQLDVTGEDGYPQSGVVPLRRLTNVEVVRLAAEEILDFARTTTPADPKEKLKPRICLVLEEAHSLVPEGNSTADRNEQTATAGTARAILQGRKYGLGCLLITQRTANVTKTILNQCHTVFAMRSFDATSESFLANYLGKEYTGLLSGLRDRQAVIFGRASTSQAPVLIELNDRERFSKEFWEECLPTIPSTDLSRRGADEEPRDEESRYEADEDEYQPSDEDYEPSEEDEGSRPYDYDPTDDFSPF